MTFWLEWDFSILAEPCPQIPSLLWEKELYLHLTPRTSGLIGWSLFSAGQRLADQNSSSPHLPLYACNSCRLRSWWCSLGALRRNAHRHGGQAPCPTVDTGTVWPKCFSCVQANQGGDCDGLLKHSCAPRSCQISYTGRGRSRSSQAHIACQCLVLLLALAHPFPPQDTKHSTHATASAIHLTEQPALCLWKNR